MIKPLTCVTCGNSFKADVFPSKAEPVTCSRLCQANRPGRKFRRGNRVVLTCPQCDGKFEALASIAHLRTFCSKACATRHRLLEDHSFLETPAQKQGARKSLEKARNSPAMKEYLNSERNPFKGPDAEKIRQSSTEANRKLGFPTLTGGNGELTIPQELLLKLLGSEFTPEFSVSLGRRQPGYPTCYKVDLGCARLKLAVELDGNSHRSKSRQALDQKKDEKLSSLGWTVLRFWNKDALENTSGTLLQIRETMSRLES